MPLRPKAPPRRRFGLWGLCCGTVALCLGVAFSLCLLLLGYAIGRDVAAPRWLRDEVASIASEALGEGRITFGGLSVHMQRDLHPVVTISDATVFDGADRRIAHLPAVNLHLSPRGLVLRRELLVQRITSAAAEVDLTRNADGALAIDFGMVPQANGLNYTEFASVFQQFDEIFEAPIFEALREVDIAGVVLRYTDLRGERSLTLDGGTLRMVLDAQNTRLTADAAVLSGRDYATRLALTYQSPRHSPAAVAQMRVTDAAAADLGQEIPGLGVLSLLDAKLSGELQIEMGESGAMTAMSAQLNVPGGALLPDVGPPGARFDNLDLALSYDPAAQRVALQHMQVSAPWISYTARGTTYLQDFQAGLPQQIVSQLEMDDITVSPPGFYDEPAQLAAAAADFRVTLDPLRIEIAGLSLRDESGGLLQADGTVAISPDGWSLMVDAQMDRLPTERLVALWPQSMRAAPHRWMAANLSGGEAVSPHLSLRKLDDGPFTWALSTGFRALDIRGLPQLPLIEDSEGFVEITAGRLGIGVTKGMATAPTGGPLDMAGSTFTIADMHGPAVGARLDLQAEGTIPAMLSVLDLPPFGYMTKANVPVDLADGRAQMQGWVTFPLHTPMPAGSVDFAFSAAMQDVTSDQIVPGKHLTSSALSVDVDRAHVAVSGPVQLNGADATARWQHHFGTPGSQVTADVAVSDALLQALAIELPLTTSGAAPGQLQVDIIPGAPPAFSLTSDLAGLAINAGAFGWQKGAASRGNLQVTGTLSTPAQVSALTLSAPGLDLRGELAMAEGGGLAEARFDRIQLNGWLNSAMTLTGQGQGRPLRTALRGGSVRLSGLQSLGGATTGNAGPLALRLDQFEVFDGLVLTDLSGDFNPTGGYSGRFTARINGGVAVEGAVFTQNGRQGVQITGADAGALLQSLRLSGAARGEGFTLTLVPDGASDYLGQFSARGLRILDAPALAQVLDAASVLGLIQQISGQGVVFDTVDATFRVSPGGVTLLSSAAVGPGLGISLDGAYSTRDAVLDFQGVVSPVYFLNGIGQVMTRPGEGVFGMTFTLGGTAGQVQVAANPLSLLAPGFLREIFRRPVPDMTRESG